MKYTIEDYLNEIALSEEEKKSVAAKAKEAVGKAAGAAKAGAGKVAGVAKEVSGKIAAKAGAAKETVKAGAGKVGATAKEVGAKAAETAKAAGGFVQAHKKAAIGVGAAAALAGGALAYRKYFGKAAKACADKKGAEKAACMKKFRAGATEAAIMALQDGQYYCDESKAPKKCYRRVNEAIEQLRLNLEVLHEG